MRLANKAWPIGIVNLMRASVVEIFTLKINLCPPEVLDQLRA